MLKDIINKKIQNYIYIHNKNVTILLRFFILTFVIINLLQCLINCYKIFNYVRI